jgi:hypothetical protein
LRDVIHIIHSKDGQGRLIKLLTKVQAHNLYNEMKDLMHTPYCVLHSHKYLSANKNALQSPGASWLPNVVVSLRSFKPLVHKLLNDHGGQMPLLSFLDCYRACILNEPASGTQNAKNHNNNNNNINQPGTKLQIDNENGVPLEHLATCAQDVIISLNEGVFKQLQWENDKSKHNLPTRQTFNNHVRSIGASGESDYTLSEFDESLEESQRKQNQFSHEVVELFKSISRCIIPLSKFSTEYHKKYGRQCRVADYGFTKLYDLIESIPHVLQILGSEYDKILTLTHRVQVRRFSNDLIKVLKSHSSKQMFADEYPNAYEKHFCKTFDIKDYGVCFLEDMLAELPESTISRKEIDDRTFIQIPKVVQMEEEKLCTQRLTLDIIDMLKHKPRFSIQFNKFIPNFHHHFGRQLKLSNYGFTKLIELLEAMPETVQVFVKDGIQFVQLKKDIMMDLICKNISNLIEMNNFEIQCENFCAFESMYNSIYDNICYEDFCCNEIDNLMQNLPFKKYFITNQTGVNFNMVCLNVETLNEREAKRLAKITLKKLMDEKDESLVNYIQYKKSNLNGTVSFNDLFNLLSLSKTDARFSSLNKRTKNLLIKLLIDYVKVDERKNDDETIYLDGFSDLYVFARQLRNLFVRTSCLDMSIQDLESLYKKYFKVTPQLQVNTEGLKFLHYASTAVLMPKKLGFIDMSLLVTQGLGLMFTIKKQADKRVHLNKEFWPISFVDAGMLNNNNKSAFNSPQSPIHSEIVRTPYTPVSYYSN